jgi:hypothetical protein
MSSIGPNNRLIRIYIKALKEITYINLVYSKVYRRNNTGFAVRYRTLFRRGGIDYIVSIFLTYI